MSDWCSKINGQDIEIPVLHELAQRATTIAQKAGFALIISVVRDPASDTQLDGVHTLAFFNRLKWRWIGNTAFKKPTPRQDDLSWNDHMRRRFEAESVTLNVLQDECMKMLLASFPLAHSRSTVFLIFDFNL